MTFDTVALEVPDGVETRGVERMYIGSEHATKLIIELIQDTYHRQTARNLRRRHTSSTIFEKIKQNNELIHNKLHLLV